MDFCAYHPKEKKYGQCQRCFRNICLLDKKTYRRQENQKIDISTKDTKYQDQVVCRVCYADLQIQGTVDIRIFVVIAVYMIFTTTLVVGSIYLADPTALSIVYIPLIMFEGPPIILAIAKLIGLIKAPKNIQFWRDDKESFLKSLERIPEGIEIISHASSEIKGLRWSNTKLYCGQCGTFIQSTVNYCPSCGDTV